MRLYLQLYWTIVGVGLLTVLTVGGLAVVMRDGRFQQDLAELAEIWAEDLPHDPALASDRIARLSTVLNGDVVLWDASGELVAGEPVRPPGHRWRTHAGGGLRVELPDGRVMGYHSRPPSVRRHVGFLILLGIVATLVAIGCWPLARRLTRRLETLRDGAERWGSGDLDARVDVPGGDEVARVGRAFNQAADRVQDLVLAQRRVLANASHELRSPLARLRMTLEFLPPGPRVDAAVGEVEDLDDIVGDVLRSARMESQSGPANPTAVPLLELFEALRADDVWVEGEPRTVLGDRRLLLRLVRNLVSNARRYGQAPIVLRTTAEGFAVDDAGQALPESERDQIFEPFYRREGHAEGVHGGVGLGLSLVRQIARFHGGDVRYVSVDGLSRFLVELPAA